MKTFPLIVSAFIFLLFFTHEQIFHSSPNSQPKEIAQITKRDVIVYICNGPKSYAFHAHPRCSGLNNCSTQIYKMNESDAMNRGRSACLKCY
jgi:hypothetical protein